METFEYENDGTIKPNCGICRKPIKHGEKVTLIPVPKDYLKYIQAPEDAVTDAHYGCVE